MAMQPPQFVQSDGCIETHHGAQIMTPREDPAGGVADKPPTGRRRGAATAIVLVMPAGLLIVGLWVGSPGAFDPPWVALLVAAYAALLLLSVRHLVRREQSAQDAAAPPPPPPADSATPEAAAAPVPTPAISPPAESPADRPARSTVHDFNNSMMTIRVSVDLLRLEHSLSPDGTSVLEDLDAAATHAASLVRDVLGDASTKSSKAEAAPPDPARPRTPPASGGRTVLLAEDERAVRRTMKLALESSGYTVLSASSADEALDIARAHNGAIDLLCTDASMPGMSVREMIDEYHRLFPSRPVLVCSGNLEEALAREGLTGSGLSYLAKPFSVNDLLLKVRGAIRGAAARDA